RGWRVLDRLIDDHVRREQRLDVAILLRTRAGEIEIGVVDVEELRPLVDAIAAEVCVRLQTHVRRGLPRRIELDAATIAAIDVPAEKQSDVRQLAGRR